MRLTINKIKLRQLRGTIKYKTNVKGKKTNKKTKLLKTNDSHLLLYKKKIEQNPIYFSLFIILLALRKP